MIEGFDRVYHMTAAGSLIVEEEMKFMADWVGFIALYAVYIVLMRWVLPRLGVST